MVGPRAAWLDEELVKEGSPHRDLVKGSTRIPVFMKKHCVYSQGEASKGV